MAKLSNTHRGDQRRAAILAAVRECFARDGFHATSMQDLLAATGLSAGAFYRYFPSKESIVSTVAASVLAEMSLSVTAEGLGGDPPSAGEIIRRVIFATERLEAEQGSARLAIQFWAEAQRNPDLAQMMTRAFSTVFQWFEEVAQTLQTRGDLPPHLPPQRIASLFIGLVHGFLVQHVLLGVSAAVYCEALTALKFDGLSGVCSGR
jgi:AcrR family transcriptional regulator